MRCRLSVVVATAIVTCSTTPRCALNLPCFPTAPIPPVAERPARPRGNEGVLECAERNFLHSKDPSHARHCTQDDAHRVLVQDKIIRGQIESELILICAVMTPPVSSPPGEAPAGGRGRKAPFTEAKRRYLELKDKPLPTLDNSVSDPPIVHNPDGSVLWRLSEYDEILRRIHASHDVAISAAKKTVTKLTAKQAASIDMTVPFSPMGEPQLASPEPTPPPAALATQKESEAFTSHLVFECLAVLFNDSNDVCSIHAQWM